MTHLEALKKFKSLFENAQSLADLKKISVTVDHPRPYNILDFDVPDVTKHIVFVFTTDKTDFSLVIFGGTVDYNVSAMQMIANAYKDNPNALDWTPEEMSEVLSEARGMYISPSTYLFRNFILTEHCSIPDSAILKLGLYQLDDSSLIFYFDSIKQEILKQVDELIAEEERNVSATATAAPQASIIPNKRSTVTYDGIPRTLIAQYDTITDLANEDSSTLYDLSEQVLSKNGVLLLNGYPYAMLSCSYDGGRLRVLTTDGVNGRLFTAFPNAARKTGGLYVVPLSQLSCNGKNYRVSNSITQVRPSYQVVS